MAEDLLVLSLLVLSMAFGFVLGVAWAGRTEEDDDGVQK